LTCAGVVLSTRIGGATALFLATRGLPQFLEFAPPASGRGWGYADCGQPPLRGQQSNPPAMPGDHYSCCIIPVHGVTDTVPVKVNVPTRETYGIFCGPTACARVIITMPEPDQPGIPVMEASCKHQRNIHQGVGVRENVPKGVVLQPYYHIPRAV